MIRIYDGKSSTDPSIKLICNEGNELEVLSTGPDLFIDFVANSDWPGQGFKAKFEFQPIEENSIGELSFYIHIQYIRNPFYLSFY